MSEKSSRWELDRRVPLSLIAMLLIQILVFGVFITRMDARVGVLERDYPVIGAQIKVAAERQRTLEMTGERIDARTIAQGKTLDTIERLMAALYRRAGAADGSPGR